MMVQLSAIIGLLTCILFGLIIFNASVSSQTTYNKIQNATQEMKVSQLNVTSNAPIIGTVSFPNPFTLFSGLMNLLVTMSSAGSDTFNALVDLPDMIRTLLVTLFILFIVLAAIGFYKGVNGA